PINTGDPRDATIMTLSSLLVQLKVPGEYKELSETSEIELVTRLQVWKNDTLRILQELNTRIEQSTDLSLDEQADIVAAVAPLDGDSEWTELPSQELAQNILHRFMDPPLTLVTHILQNNIRPLFRSNPHPEMNAETGRKLARSAGGPNASQDFFESQHWKDHPGAARTILWCVENIPTEAYDQVWHLVIPPLMILLDDYEARYKLEGVRIASEMLKRVPGSLLKRTGVDGLLSVSFQKALTSFDRPQTRELIPTTVYVSLALIEETTSIGSVQRFDQLSALLGDGIIASIWPYASDKLDALVASVDALPPIFEALGVGCARYLKVLIAQLVYPLNPSGYRSSSVELQIVSLRALATLITACAERMEHWKGTILAAVARCWVSLVESGTPDDPSETSGCFQNSRPLTDLEDDRNCKMYAKHWLLRLPRSPGCDLLLSPTRDVDPIFQDYARLQELDTMFEDMLVR
ncbi:unnamed protein product, partial [Mycena citricolor]